MSDNDNMILGNRYTVETYSCSMADGSLETGWSVKDGDDTICDVRTQTEAKRVAVLLNAAPLNYDPSDQDKMRLPAVAALIARNAELEAEREEVLQVVTKNNELLRDAMAAAEKIVAERNALAAENKALREALERAITDDGGTCRVDDGPGSRVCCGAKEFYPHEPRCWVLSAGEALARTPAATTKGNDND